MSRRALSDDPHRTRYHFQPPANWMNDPNGLLQWRGDYHMFYQYNPNGAFHGTIHWGHAVSRDLVHWSDLPIALAPTPGGPDGDGCYSGCGVDADGVPTLVYTGIRPEVQCLATSDDLVTWKKHWASPVIGRPPAGLDILGFRDPFVWREDGRWYAVVGSGIRDVGGTILLYASPDLVSWVYLGRICTGRPEETGTMWECPNFFPLGDKHVLLISPIPLRKVLCLVGTYSARRFTPESISVLDDGGCYYAPQTLLDDSGRRLIWGWLQENRSDEAQRAAGWSGVMSLPAVLSMLPGGKVGIAPAPEVEALRADGWHARDLELSPGRGNPLSTLGGGSLEIAFDVMSQAAVALDLLRSPEGEEMTRILFNTGSGQITVDREHSSLSEEVARDARSVALDLEPGEPLRVRVFVDGSVVEVYANGRVSLTSRVYPTRPDSRQIALTALRGTAQVRDLAVWSMRSIWEG